MGVKERKSWEQMSGKDFKLDAEDKKGFILFLERGPEQWYYRKKETESTACSFQQPNSISRPQRERNS